MRYNFPFKRGDFIVIAFFLLLGAGGLVYNIYYGTGEGPRYVEVYVKQELVKEIALNPGEERTYSISFGEENRHEAELEVKDGRVRMLPMDSELCPRGICSHTSWISMEHESIVCVPNRIFVSISTVEEESDVDGITY